MGQQVRWRRLDEIGWPLHQEHAPLIPLHMALYRLKRQRGMHDHREVMMAREGCFQPCEKCEQSPIHHDLTSQSSTPPFCLRIGHGSVVESGGATHRSFLQKRRNSKG